MASEEFIEGLIVFLVLASWIFSAIFGYIEKKRLKRFAEFLQMNSMAILSGATLEFDGREYSAETELVQYRWCISILVITLVRVTSFKIQDRDSSSAVMSNLLTVFGGWWGVPWGPIRSIQCLAGNCKSKIVTIRMLLCGNGFN